MPKRLIYMGFSYNLSNLYNHSPLDTRMNIKKLIASVVIALGAWMSIGVAQAQTSYNFDLALYTTPAPTGSGYSLNSPTYIGSLDFVATGNLVGGNIVLSNPTSATFGKWDTLSFNPYPSTPTYIQSYSVTSLQGNLGSNASGNFVSFNPSYVDTSFPGINSYGMPDTSLSFTANGHNYTINLNSSLFYSSIGTQDSSPVSGFAYDYNSSVGGGVAPEMNASFIPQVALMLACLFFLLGRKKENAKPMMTA